MLRYRSHAALGLPHGKLLSTTRYGFVYMESAQLRRKSILKPFTAPYPMQPSPKTKAQHHPTQRCRGKHHYVQHNALLFGYREVPARKHRHIHARHLNLHRDEQERKVNGGLCVPGLQVAVDASPYSSSRHTRKLLQARSAIFSVLLVHVRKTSPSSYIGSCFETRSRQKQRAH